MIEHDQQCELPRQFSLTGWTPGFCTAGCLFRQWAGQERV